MVAARKSLRSSLRLSERRGAGLRVGIHRALPCRTGGRRGDDEGGGGGGGKRAFGWMVQSDGFVGMMKPLKSKGGFLTGNNIGFPLALLMLGLSLEIRLLIHGDTVHFQHVEKSANHKSSYLSVT